MKRTAALIVFLIILASILLIYAINTQPDEKKTSNIIISPTATLPSPNFIADTKLFISPESIELTATESVKLNINIDTGQNQVTGVQLEIAYPQDQITAEAIMPGSFLNNSTVLYKNIDAIAGRITYALALPPSESPVNGNGNVAVLTIKKNPKNLNNGESAMIRILDKSLVTSLGIEGSVLKEYGYTTVNFPVTVFPLQNTTSTPSATNQ